PNPNSGLSAIRYSDTEVLVALNDLEKDRHRLSLYLADTKLSNWRRIQVLEQSPDPEGAPIPIQRYRKLISEHFLLSDRDSHPPLVDAYLGALDERMCDDDACEFKYDYPALSLS